MINVLFVCTGNICRSPMAEAVFMHLVRNAGLEDTIDADSAGTIGYHTGETAHTGTLNILKKHGILYNGRARRLTASDADRFDYLIAMDDEHLGTLQAMNNGEDGNNGGATIARLLDYAPQQPIREVPDPYYNGGFSQVYDLVLTGTQGLLAQIRKEQNL
jgi:protein-tyrosine phosphatase